MPRRFPRDAPALEAEIDAAVKLFLLVNTDSRNGFEASNHNYDTRLELVEKVLTCRHLQPAVLSHSP